MEKVNADLVARDDEGKPYSVRYEAVNAMLLNEFLKEHRKVETQDRRIEEQAQINQKQQAIISRLEAGLKEQATQLQKLTARLAGNEMAPRLVGGQ